MPIVWETWLVSCIKARMYLANEEEHAVPEVEVSNQKEESTLTRHAAAKLQLFATGKVKKKCTF